MSYSSLNFQNRIEKYFDYFANKITKEELDKKINEENNDTNNNNVKTNFEENIVKNEDVVDLNEILEQLGHKDKKDQEGGVNVEEMCKNMVGGNIENDEQITLNNDINEEDLLLNDENDNFTGGERKSENDINEDILSGNPITDDEIVEENENPSEKTKIIIDEETNIDKIITDGKDDDSEIIIDKIDDEIVSESENIVDKTKQKKIENNADDEITLNDSTFENILNLEELDFNKNKKITEEEDLNDDNSEFEQEISDTVVIDNEPELINIEKTETIDENIEIPVEDDISDENSNSDYSEEESYEEEIIEENKYIELINELKQKVPLSGGSQIPRKVNIINLYPYIVRT